MEVADQMEHNDRLTASDLSATPHDGSKFWISFKGCRGYQVHSLRKNAAIKAYRNCETVLCDAFEDAFKRTANE
ncbi:Arogenate dehydratase/prephenate dehydratase 1, chloroplastic [Prunus dulcis]|uniref:Arogenate dehydratase/prephenate dehydratase 1, chloroplastic n=1 Tax=Prunus dulcis TaxID=3755 RepID=A0A4Y1R789_PRUDU|nr:Arogenate dehydratase/prephenate dehydratase 1, chloroplastic [Prunus dulcis]